MGGEILFYLRHWFAYANKMEKCMTKSEVKYLIALYELAAIEKSIKQSNLADKLGLTKVSVFKAIENLSYKKCVKKESNGKIMLTEKGKEIAEKYILCSERVSQLIIECLGCRANRGKKDSLAIVCAMSDENINKLYENVNTTKEMYMPIIVAPIGQELRIIKIATDDKTRKHLESLGITINSTIEVVLQSGGSIICIVKDGRLALDKDIAVKIFVA
jgi:ferrous iron transport protein A